MTRDEGIEKVRGLVATCLALELEEVDAGHRLVDDLGADSLDFLDLIFSLEQTFGIQVREGEMSFLSRLDAASPTALVDGHLKPEAVARLRPWLPALADEDPTKVTPARLFSLLTVETLWRLVAKKLEERASETEADAGAETGASTETGTGAAVEAGAAAGAGTVAETGAAADTGAGAGAVPETAAGAARS